MSEGPSLLAHVRRSVFTKLVVTMLAMAAMLLTLVVVFFLLYLGPVLNGSIDGVVHESCTPSRLRGRPTNGPRRWPVARACRHATKVQTAPGQLLTTCRRRQK